MLRGIDLKDMSRMNRAAALRLILRTGGISRATLAERLQLAPPSLTRIAGQLLDVGLVRETSTRAERGRPPSLLRINPDWAHVITVNLVHTLGVGVVDLTSRLIYRETLYEKALIPGVYREEFPALVPEAVQRLVKQEMARGRVLGVGVISSGIVSPDGTLVEHLEISQSPVDVRRLLASVTDLPTHVDEEVRLMLWERYWNQDRLLWRNAMAISGDAYGYDGGHAAMVDGHLTYGRVGMAGYAGYLLPHLHGEDFVRDSHARILAMGGFGNYLERIRGGEPEAMDIYGKAVENYGYRLAILAHCYDPEATLVCLPYAQLGERFLFDIRKEFEKHIHPRMAPDARFVLAERSREDQFVAAAVPVLTQFYSDGDIGERVVQQRPEAALAAAAD